MAASPGIGGPKWNEAIEAARAEARGQSDSDAQAKALQRIDEDLAHWLVCARFNPSNGAPGDALSECCAKVARWAGRRGGVAGVQASEREQVLALASLASELADLLRAFPSVKRAQLEGLNS